MGRSVFKHRYVKDDAMRFVKTHPAGPAYDLAAVDPPTFSNSKKLARDWDVQNDHARLLNRVLELLAPGGDCFLLEQPPPLQARRRGYPGGLHRGHYAEDHPAGLP